MWTNAWQIESNNGIYEIKSEKNWQSQIDSSYNNLYLIQIKNISHETQTNFKIKLTYDNVEYESQKLMNITDYFESNSQKPESIAFLFLYGFA